MSRPPLFEQDAIAYRPGAGSDIELIARYNQRIPRYTSYPTAPCFSRDVNEQTYASWLESFPPGEALSLYMHIPFCPELCLYCGCHTTVVRNYGPVASYLDLLMREIAIVAAHLSFRPRISTIHFGGGTPTILSPKDLLDVADKLKSSFDVPAEAEIAVEIDPRRLDAERVRALADMGTTRASLGIQEFDPEVQRAVNRIQPFDTTARVVSRLRDAGIRALNFDLMYGLPHQTVATVLSSIEQAVSLQPDRISLFGYAHVPWMKRHQALLDAEALPDTADRLHQMRAGSEAIVRAGYVAIGLDHFARPDDLLARRQRDGQLRRNFQGYTADPAASLIGLGASAIGALPQGYVQNSASTPTYRDAILAGRLATARGRSLTGEDRVRRAVIERLMCDLTVDLETVAVEHGFAPDFFCPEIERIAGLVADGLVQCEGRKLIVPNPARPFVRSVCAVFDAYLSKEEGRYSRAV